MICCVSSWWKDQKRRHGSSLISSSLVHLTVSGSIELAKDRSSSKGPTTTLPASSGIAFVQEVTTVTSEVAVDRDSGVLSDPLASPLSRPIRGTRPRSSSTASSNSNASRLVGLSPVQRAYLEQANKAGEPSAALLNALDTTASTSRTVDHTAISPAALASYFTFPGPEGAKGKANDTSRSFSVGPTSSTRLFSNPRSIGVAGVAAGDVRAATTLPRPRQPRRPSTGVAAEKRRSIYEETKSMLGLGFQDKDKADASRKSIDSAQPSSSSLHESIEASARATFTGDLGAASDEKHARRGNLPLHYKLSWSALRNPGIRLSIVSPRSTPAPSPEFPRPIWLNKDEDAEARRREPQLTAHGWSVSNRRSTGHSPSSPSVERFRTSPPISPNATTLDLIDAFVPFGLSAEPEELQEVISDPDVQGKGLEETGPQASSSRGHSSRRDAQTSHTVIAQPSLISSSPPSRLLLRRSSSRSSIHRRPATSPEVTARRTSTQLIPGQQSSSGGLAPLATDISGQAHGMTAHLSESPEVIEEIASHPPSLESASMQRTDREISAELEVTSRRDSIGTQATNEGSSRGSRQSKSSTASVSVTPAAATSTATSHHLRPPLRLSRPRTSDGTGLRHPRAYESRPLDNAAAEGRHIAEPSRAQRNQLQPRLTGQRPSIAQQDLAIESGRRAPSPTSPVSTEDGILIPPPPAWRSLHEQRVSLVPEEARRLLLIGPSLTEQSRVTSKLPSSQPAARPTPTLPSVAQAHPVMRPSVSEASAVWNPIQRPPSPGLVPTMIPDPPPPVSTVHPISRFTAAHPLEDRLRPQHSEDSPAQRIASSSAIPYDARLEPLERLSTTTRSDPDAISVVGSLWGTSSRSMASTRTPATSIFSNDRSSFGTGERKRSIRSSVRSLGQSSRAASQSPTPLKRNPGPIYAGLNVMMAQETQAAPKAATAVAKQDQEQSQTRSWTSRRFAQQEGQDQTTSRSSHTSGRHESREARTRAKGKAVEGRPPVDQSAATIPPAAAVTSSSGSGTASAGITSSRSGSRFKKWFS